MVSLRFHPWGAFVLFASTSLFLLILGIIFIASTIRATLGFGDAVLALPVLNMLIHPHEAQPLMALCSLSIAIWMTWRDWRDMAFDKTWRLLITVCIGMPIGVYFLKTADASFVKGGLAVTVIGFSLFRLVNARRRNETMHLKSKPSEDEAYGKATSHKATSHKSTSQKSTSQKSTSHGMTYAVGLLAGVMCGAYNILGVIIAVYGTLADWDLKQLRVTLQGVMLPAGCLLVATHASWGLLTTDILKAFAFALPSLIVAGMIGQFAAHRVKASQFDRIITVTLLVVGVLLLASAISMS